MTRSACAICGLVLSGASDEALREAHGEHLTAHFESEVAEGRAERVVQVMTHTTNVIDLVLRVVPPSTTAQQKRVQVVRNRAGRHVPRFFHSETLQREAHTWATLLQPHVPRVPMAGPVTLSIHLVYPHMKGTAKRDQASLVPKVSRPDVGNTVKHLEDVLVQMRFMEDDQQVARLVAEKWHGPADQVGIRITIAPIGEGSSM